MQSFSCVFQCGMQNLDQWERFDWRERYFHNNHPIVLELGCGHGDYTIGLARLHPEINYIGVDIKGARMWAGARIAEAEQISNVAFLRTNIEMLPHFFAPNEVDGIWLTFPDPQMKKATKRLTSTYFMARYRQLLKDGATIQLKTDSPFLYTYTHEMVYLNRLCCLADTQDLYASAAKDYSDELREAVLLQTHYEKQWLDRGMTIKYLKWQLPKTGELVEPDIEIEKDTYRSYGRNYTQSNSEQNQ